MDVGMLVAEGSKGPSISICISVKTLTGRIYTLTIAKDCKVQSIFDNYAHVTGENNPLDRLVFRGRTLEREKFVNDYGIIDDSEIHYVKKRIPQRTEQIQEPIKSVAKIDSHPGIRILKIYIETLSGKRTELNVSDTCTIQKVLEKYNETKESYYRDLFDSDGLIWAGRKLERHMTVRDCKINPDSVLHLVKKLRGG
jgi:hypothetical protein